MRRFGTAATAALAWAATGAAWADQPVARGIDLQPAATPAMEQIHSFHNFLLPIIVVVSAFVLVLLLWVIVRYNRRANPTPRTFTHNVLVEVVWTIVPVLILVFIAWRSFPLLYQQEHVPPPAVTIKVIGNSWFWQYEYQDLNLTVASNQLPEADARAQGRPNLLAVDNPILVPVGENVQLLITSNDVIHSWTVPAFGVKQDAIPGRVNHGWFNVQQPGTYYGQCSELCGINHAFMPIEVHAVPRAEFDQWVVAQGGSLASGGEEAAPAAPAR